MNISKLILELEKIKTQYGDLEFVYVDYPNDLYVRPEDYTSKIEVVPESLAVVSHPKKPNVKILVVD